MGRDTAISWTHHTWNPWWGCTKVNTLCDSCYADLLDRRCGGDHWGDDKPRRYIKSVWTDVHKWNAEAKAAGERHRIFCMSMGDFWEKPMPVVDSKGNMMPGDTSNLRDRAFKEVIGPCDSLDWMLLTKRPGNFFKYAPEEWSKSWPEHCWALASAGTKTDTPGMVSILSKVPSVVRGLSMEPLLDKVDLGTVSNIDKVNLVIVGCESHGPAVGRLSLDGDKNVDRWMEWAIDIADFCRNAGIAFFCKQIPHPTGRELMHAENDVWDSAWPDALKVREMPTVNC